MNSERQQRPLCESCRPSGKTLGFVMRIFEWFQLEKTVFDIFKKISLAAVRTEYIESRKINGETLQTFWVSGNSDFDDSCSSEDVEVNRWQNR
jgi:hypothetical protein